MDIFSGACTTGLVSRKLNRDFVGCDLNEDYLKMSITRLDKELGMKISIDIERLERIKAISYYNHNYFKLPFSVNGCNVLYQHYSLEEEFAGYSIGILAGDNFSPKFWLHTPDENDTVVFDSNCIEDHNKWT